MRTPDVVIAGAGVIGLACALELAGQGLDVTVLEQGQAMREASWAAAGMLAVDDPENPPELWALAVMSRAIYPDFLKRVEELSGLRVPFRTRLTLQGVRRGPGGAASVIGKALVQGLAPELVQELVRELTSGPWSFAALEEASLDPRDLCLALPAAVRSAGVSLREQTEVRSVQADGERLVVSTSDGPVSARQYVHATGAWASLCQVCAPGAEALPVEPRKGQIITVKLPEAAPQLTCVLRTPEVYLVPRGARQIVVGATVEQAGFDRTLHEAAAETLLARAAALWPPIRQGAIVERWCGFRPATPDGLPILSELAPAGRVLGSSQQMAGAGAPKVWAATGHFRNGILLAPSTARVLRQLILGQTPEVMLEAFSACRFAPANTRS